MTSPTITVEIAFATNPLSAPTWVDVTSYLVSIPLIRRGRQHELNRIEAGEATVVLNNLDRRFDPTNTAGPYYPNVLPMRRIRISATYSATTYRLFTGFIEGWPPEWPLDGSATTTLQCVDGFKILNLIKLTTTLPSEFSGWAAATVLSTAGWPAGDTSATGAGSNTFVQAQVMAETPALQRLQDIVDAENGLAYIRGDGVLVYQNRHWRYENSTSVTSQATIGDGVGELPYTKLELSYDDSQIWNDVRITPTGGTVQTASDSTSQSIYAKRTLARTLIIGDASGVGGNTQAVEAKSAAQYLLANYKEPALRATSASVRPVSDATGALWTQILNRTLSDRITTTKRPPGGGAAITGDYFIEAIEHRIGNVAEDWETTWQLSPANAQAFWIMQNATFGLLDSTTRLAY